MTYKAYQLFYVKNPAGQVNQIVQFKVSLYLETPLMLSVSDNKFFYQRNPCDKKICLVLLLPISKRKLATLHFWASTYEIH